MQNQQVAMNWHGYYTLSDSYISNIEKGWMQVGEKYLKLWNKSHNEYYIYYTYLLKL
jgi:hypothetical protein